MSTVKATNFQHPSAGAAGITLGSDGSVVLPSGFTGGLGTNVQSTAVTTAFTTTSASYVDITDLTATITPTSVTAKVLVILQVGQMRKSTNGSVRIQIDRDGSGIYDYGVSETPAGQQGSGSTLVFLDSPATTSAVVYKGQTLAVGGGTLTVDSMSITVIEVAA